MQAAADELITETSGVDVQSLSRQFGLSEDQTRRAVASLLPLVMGGVQRTQGTGGMDQLGALAGGVQHPATAVPQGNQILGHIFGSKDVSRQVASHAAQQSGIPDRILKAMLPVVAAMVAQAVAKRMGGGILGQLAGSMVGGMAGGRGGSLPGGFGGAPATANHGGLGGLIGMLAGGPGGANPLDAILGHRR